MKSVGTILAPIALVVCSACAPGSTANQMVPSAIAPSRVALGTLDAGPGFVAGPNSCPTDVVSNVSVNPHRDGAAITWQLAPGIHDYYIAIDRWDADNKWLNALDQPYETVSDQSFVDMPLHPGHYQVRVRTHSSCDTLGPWSPNEEFTVTAPRISVCTVVSTLC